LNSVRNYSALGHDKVLKVQWLDDITVDGSTRSGKEEKCKRENLENWSC